MNQTTKIKKDNKVILSPVTYTIDNMKIDAVYKKYFTDNIEINPKSFLNKELLKIQYILDENVSNDKVGVIGYSRDDFKTISEYITIADRIIAELDKIKLLPYSKKGEKNIYTISKLMINKRFLAKKYLTSGTNTLPCIYCSKQLYLSIPSVRYNHFKESLFFSGEGAVYVNGEFNKNSKITSKYTATVDHVIPTSKGGTLEESNLEICCQECNTKKSDKSLDEWETQLSGRKKQVSKQTVKKVSVFSPIEKKLRDTIDNFGMGFNKFYFKDYYLDNEIYADSFLNYKLLNLDYSYQEVCSKYGFPFHKIDNLRIFSEDGISIDDAEQIIDNILNSFNQDCFSDRELLPITNNLFEFIHSLHKYKFLIKKYKEGSLKCECCNKKLLIAYYNVRYFFIKDIYRVSEMVTYFKNGILVNETSSTRISKKVIPIVYNKNLLKNDENVLNSENFIVTCNECNTNKK